MPLAPGDKLFEYRIIRTLGQGAFGTVYLAEDTLLDRPVAIKELTAAAQADQVAFQRFLQEARAAGSLNHPNIVTVYALKPTDTAVCLVMEYLPGGSLRTLLNQRGRLPVEDAVRIAADVCDGLAAAHARGIVHRDVKPENILLTADGRAKVGDFGIAHVPHTAGGATVGGLTQTGFQPGTLVYMSPEQIRGEGIDGRSDVFQVGTVLHEMLAGRHYLDIEALTRRAQETAGGNVLRQQARLYDLLEKAICEDELSDVRRLRSDVSDWLGAAVISLLARQAASRPTAAQVARKLRKTKVGRPDEAIRKNQVVRQTGSEKAKEHFDLGVVYQQQGRTEKAIRAYLAALVVNPDFSEAHVNLGVIYAQQDRAAEAIRAFQAALRVNPDDAVAHFNLGNTYGQQGRTDEAIRAYQMALRINPAYADAHYSLGNAYGQQDRIVEAIRELQTALRLNPDHVEARYYLGVAYGQQGRTTEAIREFHAVLQINPDLAEAHNSLGLAYRQQGRTDEAIQAYQAALRINPDDTDSHVNLGVIYGQQGRTDEAIREFLAALRLNPDDAEVRLNLSEAYWKQGRLAGARREAQHALQLGYAPAKQFLAMLE